MSSIEIPRNLVVVDVEASDRTPMSGHMTEFGAVHPATGSQFYAQLYSFTPHLDIPALPVVEVRDGEPVQLLRVLVDGINDTGVRTHRQLAEQFAEWAKSCSKGGVTLVSDNPAFDGMWINCFLDKHGCGGALGFSGRRIGDFAAGLSGKWSDHNAWKKLRRTKHTHNPLDDAQGNAEALIALLELAAKSANGQEGDVHASR